MAESADMNVQKKTKRQRMREKGYVLRGFWVHQDDVPHIRDLVTRTTMKADMGRTVGSILKRKK